MKLLLVVLLVVAVVWPSRCSAKSSLKRSTTPLVIDPHYLKSNRPPPTQAKGVISDDEDPASLHGAQPMFSPKRALMEVQQGIAPPPRPPPPPPPPGVPPPSPTPPPSCPEYCGTNCYDLCGYGCLASCSNVPASVDSALRALCVSLKADVYSNWNCTSALKACSDKWDGIFCVTPNTIVQLIIDIEILLPLEQNPYFADVFANLTSLVYFSSRNPNVTGEFPPSLSSLLRLNGMFLGRNDLMTGTVPDLSRIGTLNNAGGAVDFVFTDMPNIDGCLSLPAGSNLCDGANSPGLRCPSAGCCDNVDEGCSTTDTPTPSPTQFSTSPTPSLSSTPTLLITPSPSLSSTPPNESPSPSDGENSSMIIEEPSGVPVPVLAGAVIGGVVLIAILIGLLVFFLLRRKSKKRRDSFGLIAMGPVAPASGFTLNMFLDASLKSEANGYKLTNEYYQTDLAPYSKEYEMAIKLLETYADGKAVVDSKAISKITSVFNPRIAEAFRLAREKIADRIVNDPATFNKQDWRQADRGDQRTAVKEHLQSVIATFPWNVGARAAATPVVLAVHGTNLPVAEGIVSHGFAALSLLDAGFYGAGIYLTSSVNYAMPYFATKDQPVILVCLVTPGNAYPVVEASEEANSLKGRPIRGGYQSHYVLTSAKGDPVRPGHHGAVFDEFVFGQESNIVPIFIVQFDKTLIQQAAIRFQNEHHVDVDAIARRDEFTGERRTDTSRVTASRLPPPVPPKPNQFNASQY